MKHFRSILFRAAMIALVAMLLITSTTFAAKPLFTVESWDRPYSGSGDWYNFNANDVSWIGGKYKSATNIQIGFRICDAAGSNCVDYNVSGFSISIPDYPQNITLTAGANLTEGNCSYNVFVKLYNAKGHVLVTELYSPTLIFGWCVGLS